MTQSTRPTREHGALRQQVVDQLRAEIIAGVLAPGEPLRTEAVMDRFGVSNSPLREAFAQLAAEGLIEVYRNRGAVVAPLTREGAADLLTVAGLLWRTSYAWAVPRLRGADLAPVRRAATDFDLSFRSGDTTTAFLDGTRFDRLVLERCGSEELPRIVRASQGRVDRVRRLLDTSDQVMSMAVVVTETMAAVQDADVARSIAAVDALWAGLDSALDRTNLGFAG
jgi:DNA-binding GntR family transcriptional regulator